MAAPFDSFSHSTESSSFSLQAQSPWYTTSSTSSGRKRCQSTDREAGGGGGGVLCLTPKLKSSKGGSPCPLCSCLVQGTALSRGSHPSRCACSFPCRSNAGIARATAELLLKHRVSTCSTVLQTKKNGRRERKANIPTYFFIRAA